MTNEDKKQSLFLRAMSYAESKHLGQKRKATQVPYITHPVIVAETISYYYPDNEVLWQAALLHDVVEDTGVSSKEIEEKFGAEVAGLVLAVSKNERSDHLPEDMIQRWRVEREDMLRHVDEATADAVRLKAADTLANMKAIIRDIYNPEVGLKIWDRFNAGSEDMLWYYDEIFKRVEARISDEPIVAELKAVTRKLRELTP